MNSVTISTVRPRIMTPNPLKINIQMEGLMDIREIEGILAFIKTLDLEVADVSIKSEYLFLVNDKNYHIITKTQKRNLLGIYPDALVIESNEGFFVLDLETVPTF